MDNATYLGDGLYAVLQNGMIELRANDFENPSDVVYLERGVLVNMIEFAKSKGFIEGV